ncbi:MAG TPA: sensor histidine kinase, partial [Acinetobacter sp.]|nr:sensor histidine kinase [Acinetobacter sp.]
MAIQLLDLQHIEKLSACKIALTLGVNSPQNLLDQFLQFNRQLAQASIALLSFHQEPYLWHRCPEHLKAIETSKISKSLKTLFLNDDFVDQSHPQYSILLEFLQPLNLKVQGAVALHLRHPD